MYDLDEVDQPVDAAADDVPDFMKPDDTWKEDAGAAEPGNTVDRENEPDKE
jgi:hypothetical protein